MVLSGRAVGRQERSDLQRREAGVGHARKDLVSGVGRFRHRQVGRGARNVRAAGHELELGTAAAVGHADGTRELNAAANGGKSADESRFALRYAQVTERDVVLDCERPLGLRCFERHLSVVSCSMTYLNNFVDTNIGIYKRSRWTSLVRREATLTEVSLNLGKCHDGTVLKGSELGRTSDGSDYSPAPPPLKTILRLYLS